MPMKPVVPEPTPFLRQCANSITHFERHQHGLERRVLDLDRIVEDDHHTVANVPFEHDDLRDARATRP
jgi:hypothetical protein